MLHNIAARARSRRVKPADGESAAAVTPTLAEARDAYRQALREGDNLAFLALLRLGNQRGYPVAAQPWPHAEAVGRRGDAGGHEAQTACGARHCRP